MPNQLFWRMGRAMCTLGVLAFASACSETDPIVPHVAPLTADFLIEVSSVTAPAGANIAVAVTPRVVTSIGALQGYFLFDPSRLEYVGQRTDDGSYVLVNDTRADAGELRFGAVQPTGLNHVGNLVFRVRRPNYTNGMSLKIEEAATSGSELRLFTNTDVIGIPMVNAALSVPDRAERASLAQWMARADSIQRGKGYTPAVPGQIVPGLLFGDANLNGVIASSDGVYLIGVSIGLNEMIFGTDSPATDAVVAGNVFPENLPGLGESNDALPPGFATANDRGSITLSDALAVFNFFFFPQNIVGKNIPGRPSSPASNRIIVSSNITTNTTWTKNNIYELQGGVMVTNNATLTIEAGTLIEGARGTGPGVGGSALFVQRDGRILAVGTAFEPIVFTCVGVPKAKGCWGGMTINGNAPLNEGTQTSPSVPGRDGGQTGCFEKTGEGASGLYGGCNANDDSGILKYVRVEYAGFRFTTTNELNGIAFQGVGKNTQIDYIQVHAGLDDGVEFFGGVPNVKHLVLTANEDDGFDWVEGFSGMAQYVIIQKDSADSDNGIEADNTNTSFNALPRALPSIWNFTIVGMNPNNIGGIPGNNDTRGMHIRRGTRPNMGNFLVINEPKVIRIDDNDTCLTDATGGPFKIVNSLFAGNVTLYDAASSASCITNFLTTAPSVNNVFPGAQPLLKPFSTVTPDFRPAFGTAGGGAAPPSDPFFDQAGAAFMGAVPPAAATKGNIPWYSGWTRGWQAPTVP